MRHSAWLLLVACLVGAAPRPVDAASAVAYASDGTFGYSFNHKSDDDAQKAALRSCQRRTNRPCAVVMSCGGHGYGAIAVRRPPGANVEALGTSCGMPSPEAAYRRAIDECNARAKTGRCGQPRTAWRDTEGGDPTSE